MSMRVVVTRPKNEARKWVDALVAGGYDAVALPLIEIGAAPNPDAVVQAWLGLHAFDAVMFVSSNAVDHFFALKPSPAPVFTAQAAIKTRAFVTGPGTFAALLRAHAKAGFIDGPDRLAGQFDSEALWAVVQHKVRPGYRVLVVRGVGGPSASVAEGYGRDWFASKVQSAGGAVEFVVAYQRSCPVPTPAELALVRASANADAVWIFSSSEAITNLVAACPGQSWASARALVTHSRIGLAARDAGFSVVYESRPTLGSLMASIESMQ